MTADDYEAEVKALAVAYPGAALLEVPDQCLIRLPEVTLTGQWSPPSVRALLVCDGWPHQRPRLLMGDELRRHGAEPANFSRELIGGEAWFSYSFTSPYASTHPALVPAVRGWLARFDGRSD